MARSVSSRSDQELPIVSRLAYQGLVRVIAITIYHHICVIFTLCVMLFGQGVASIASELATMSAEERSALHQQVDQLRLKLKSVPDQDAVNVEVFLKGIEWALRYDATFSESDRKTLDWSLQEAKQRLEASTQKRPVAPVRSGALVRGYRSQVDQSVQPYGVLVPNTYDPLHPMRLDVVLHGSTRPVGMAELRFMKRFDSQDHPTEGPPSPYLELHPLGRVENCYRWAGETDVFEAIDDVCRHYSIDRRRIVLRGMSMGASGTWHLGLKHPDRFVALGPYCGYVDTHRFSATPFPNFVKVGPLPEHQEAALHLLDAVDYAANAKMVPSIACMGEKDPFFEAHVIMRDAMEREGLSMVNLISPGTGHEIDPVIHSEQLRLIAQHVSTGQPESPLQVDFVTWTLKYSSCYWIQLLELVHHYKRADISARFDGDRLIVDKLNNIARFSIRPSQTPRTARTVQIGNQVLELPQQTDASSDIILEQGEGAWRLAAPAKPMTEQPQVYAKRPGLQGPIDDAFTGPFLCVRGTGSAWNELPHRYAMASLQRFAQDWHHYFRGHLPVKDDIDVTPEDIQTKHLILFGDPGSNHWIADALPRLPLTWTKTELRLGDRTFAAANHAPVLIAPNPLTGGAGHYIVLNSGHSFHGAELGRINYLLFPRWGDWAVMQLQPDRPNTIDDPAELQDNVQAVGYFDERWSLAD